MRRHGVSLVAIGFLFLALVVLAVPGTAANIYDYCQTPPYVNQLTPPNVMILMDTSTSMLNFAYYDGFNTPNDSSDDVPCNDLAFPCTQYKAPLLINPDYKYYGYFNPDVWYVNPTTNVFTEAGPKRDINGTPTAKPSGGWDGNFLNWLTMRRIDILRKVLTGGKPSGNKLTGEIADNVDRGIYKKYGNANEVSPFPGNTLFTFRTANSGTSLFEVQDGGTTYTYTVAVEVPLPVAGVLQNVLEAKARPGLAFFNEPGAGDPLGKGGNVRWPVDAGSLPGIIAEINLSRPKSNTPLGEALWSMAGYFARMNAIPAMTGVNNPGSPGPMYHPSDYPVTSADDPLNYGSGGNPRFPYCAKSFVLLITDGEPCGDGDLPSAPFNLVNYAGSVGDVYNCVNDNCPTAPRTDAHGVSNPFPTKSIPVCDKGGNVAGLEDVALWAHTTDLRSPTLGANVMPGTQNLNLYIVSVFSKGSTLLRYAAINGGFQDLNGNNLPDSDPALQGEWDANGDGEPDNFNEATDGQEIEDAVRDALSTMLKRASSGTAASVLASGEGSGANLVQAVFYPRRQMGNDIAWWSGVLKNVWFYIDPYMSGASIREETTADGVLDLRNDYISQFYFDNTTQTTRVKRIRDVNGDGSVLTYVDNVAFENMKNLWEAGQLLYVRNPATRTIYTQVDNTNLIAFDNSSVSVAAIAPYTGLSSMLTPYLIRYVRGDDSMVAQAAMLGISLRRRGVGADNNVWKLGDIIQSTPRIAGKVPLNTYDKIYGDTTYREFVSDSTYLDRGMVFTGANDGMLHAFKMGKLETPLARPTYNPDYQKAKLTNLVDPPPLGYEAWAFIPKNALPYLTYLKDPDYCHLYYVDLAPYVFDASIGAGSGDQSSQARSRTSWRTVVIGGMRTGGACRDSAGTCNSTTDGLADCVKSPLAGKGFSSYFALDVTTPESPRLLWEFSDPDLGFSTSGPAIVRIHADNTITGVKDQNLNGKWYVVFASGPTGPIDNTSTQFLGHSDQNLKLFVVNLKTGALVRKIDTTIANAFGGSLVNTVADFDLDYQDEAVYLGFTRKDASVTPATWTKGGVLRLQTRQDSNVANWTVSKLIDNIGPVTTAPARLQNRYYGLNWVFFGEGRYYYTRETATGGVDIDDPGGTAGYPGRWLYGVKDPCFTGNGLAETCPAAINLATDNVADVTNPPFPQESVMNCRPGTAGCGNFGWRIGLDNATVSPALANERMITDSLATTTSGLVFFSTFKPYAEACAIGGRSFLWVARYNTGGAPAATSLRGKALVQVSTASIEEIDLPTAFQDKGGRRSGSIEGVPPLNQGLSILSPPPPMKKTLHMQEK